MPHILLITWVGLFSTSVTGFVCPRGPCSFLNYGFGSCRLPSALRSWISVKDYESIDEILRVTSENIDELSPNTLAAVWSTMPRLMSKQTRGQHVGDDSQKLRGQILIILKQTMNKVNKMRPKELTTIILGMAKIVKNV